MGQPIPVLATPSAEFDLKVLQVAFDASQEGMALAEDGNICYANRSFAKLVGFRNPTDLQHRSLASLRPKDHPCAWAQRDSSQSEAQHHLCQFATEATDGTALRIESTCSRFRAESREFVLVTIRDVTVRERRRILRDEDRRFRTIFDGAPMGIVQCDMEGRVLETNPAVERMLGYSLYELREMHFHDFTKPEDAESELKLFQEMVAGKRESYELEARYVGKNAITGWVRLTVSLVRGVDGRPQFAIAMTEEITERKLAEQRLREAQKMEIVGRLVGGVAHDFNNLLTGIMLYCDLLMAGLDRGSRLMHHAEEIRIAGQQGGALIQQLLAISRQQVVEPKILCVNDVILGTKNLLSRLLGENFELQTLLGDGLGDVRMDPAQVQQILFNLVLNARDAMVSGGSIVVETCNADFLPADAPKSLEPGPAVMLSVKDRGCGMSKETLARLFEPFFTTKVNGRGTGLGLATVHDIVESNGGKIQVDSEPGRGTEITVWLPCVYGHAGKRVAKRASKTAACETILLVEDNLAVRGAARKILSETGYVVLEAGDGAEAIRVARDHVGTIDLLLADIVMPGMHGRELARQLRSERQGMRALYMSGYEPSRTESEAEGDPVVCFKKPFTGAALLDKLRESLERGSSKVSEKRKREKP
jgi:two-component system cell cycle sensor histidine kinase/response regulator CckA